MFYRNLGSFTFINKLFQTLVECTYIYVGRCTKFSTLLVHTASSWCSSVLVQIHDCVWYSRQLSKFLSQKLGWKFRKTRSRCGPRNNKSSAYVITLTTSIYQVSLSDVIGLDPRKLQRHHVTRKVIMKLISRATCLLVYSPIFSIYQKYLAPWSKYLPRN